jgi:hypothetical protein
MDTTADNDYFELEPYDQYRPQEVNNFKIFEFFLPITN